MLRKRENSDGMPLTSCVPALIPFVQSILKISGGEEAPRTVSPGSTSPSNTIEQKLQLFVFINMNRLNGYISLYLYSEKDIKFIAIIQCTDSYQYKILNEFKRGL